MDCLLGDLPPVKEHLKAASPPTERHELLEHRHTTFRAPALMIVTAFAKYPNLVEQKARLEQIQEVNQQEGVAKALFRYMVNPLSKDVVGKAMVAGCISTPLTRRT